MGVCHLKVLLKLYVLAYDPMAQSEDSPLKIIMGKKSEEEIKIVYNGPKYVRGGSHLRDIDPR